MKDPFKNLKLTKEEQEIEAVIEHGDYKPVANFEQEKSVMRKLHVTHCPKEKALPFGYQNAILCVLKLQQLAKESRIKRLYPL